METLKLLKGWYRKQFLETINYTLTFLSAFSAVHLTTEFQVKNFAQGYKVVNLELSGCIYITFTQIYLAGALVQSNVGVQKARGQSAESDSIPGAGEVKGLGQWCNDYSAGRGV